MARNPNRAPAAPPTAPPVGGVEGIEGAAPDSPLERFSRELAQRFPHRMVRRYIMPGTVREAREVFIMEITSRDEVEAAIMADAVMSTIEKQSIRLSGDSERRECIRLSLVGIRRTAADAYEHLNADGAPLSEINEWSGKAWTALQTFFGTLNGVPVEELAAGLQGALTVGAFAPPTSAIRASAESGK